MCLCKNSTNLKYRDSLARLKKESKNPDTSPEEHFHGIIFQCAIVTFQNVIVFEKFVGIQEDQFCLNANWQPSTSLCSTENFSKAKKKN